MRCILYIRSYRHHVLFYFIVHHILEIETHPIEQEYLANNNNRKIDVIIVESVDKAYANNKNEILVKPESNPYYETESYQEQENPQTVSLENSIDKIKAINNMYYE